MKTAKKTIVTTELVGWKTFIYQKLFRKVFLDCEVLTRNDYS